MSKKEKKIGKRTRDERIWKIRDWIQELEDVKDEIIDFLTQIAENDGYNIWITDAKEVYYNIVSAWELLSAVARGEEKHIESARGYLALAKSRQGQCSSELITLEAEGSELNTRLIAAFEKSWNAINTELENLASKEEIKPPSKRILKVSDTEYHLLCSVCGKVAVYFKLGVPRFSEKKSLICSGIVHSAAINLSAAETIFSWLEQDQISEIHTYLEKNTVVFEEGIDAYCPECDKIYCWIHYDPVEEWDEGFYDDTIGTCPEGHKRIIHD